jgi:hypothetical protein
MVRKLVPCFEKILELNWIDLCSIFKPNATLAKVVEDTQKLDKGHTKQDTIVGGSGNRHNYSTENNPIFIVEKTLNMLTSFRGTASRG